MPRRLVLRAAIALSFSTVVVSGAPQTPQTPPHLSVRFHHVHYFVPDPAAAMADAVRDLGARRVILPGVGVGVAMGEQYLFFDRAPSASPLPVVSVQNALDRALRWLNETGMAVPAPPDASTLPAASDSRWIKHVAFATDNIAAVAAYLRARRGDPFHESDETLVYRAPDGAAVEFVRDTDRPDAFWCPMHPDVRSPFASTCPLCSMALVAIPPPKLGEYRMDVSTIPGRVGKDKPRLRFTIRDPESGAAVDEFIEVHERLFHLFIVSRDLRYFAHEHPELSGGRFDLAVDLPPGTYMLIADFLPAGGTPQMVQQAIVTGHQRTAFAPPPALKLDPPDKVVDGVRVRLTTNLAAGREGTLTFSFADAATGAPVADLQPYLGAPGHLLIVNSDLTDAFHAHPGSAPTTGPEMTFAQLLPSAGFYKLWLQVQRGGKVITVAFVIDVK